MTLKKIQLALVDDHTLFREGLRDLLLDQPDLEILSEGADGYDALTLAAKKNLDVLLIDIRMPRLGGVGAIRQIREARPDLKIIVVSMFEDEDHMRAAVVAGADAYHSKMDDAKTIIKTIRDLMTGKKYFSDMDRVQLGVGLEVKQKSLPESLTETEYRVLEQLSRGESNRDMAVKLNMSEQTLKNHVSTVFRKLGVRNRIEAVRWAMEHNFISPSV